MVQPDFKRYSPSEFFKENLELLGYTGKLRALTTLVNEGVTNAIGAAERLEVLPDLYVAIRSVGKDPNHYRIVIEDNASGVPEDSVLKMFEMFSGSKTHQNAQSRGRGFGIGISGALLFAQTVSGESAKITTSTENDNEINCYEITLDSVKNEAKIIDYERIEGRGWRGTRIELEVKNVDYQRSKHSPFNYLRMVSVTNPHVEIKFEEPDGSLTVFERTTGEIPEKPEPVLPHPSGIKSNKLLKMAESSESKRVGTFLVNLPRFSRKKLKGLEETVEIDLDKGPSELSKDDAEKLVENFRDMDFMAPPSGDLCPIGEEQVEKALNSMLSPIFVSAVTRSPKVQKGGSPFIVEVGLAYGGEVEDLPRSKREGLEIIRFVNRNPLMFGQGESSLSKATRDIDWERYNVNPEKSPLTILIHIASSRIPYRSLDKQSLVHETEIYEEVRQAVMQAARRPNETSLNKIDEMVGELRVPPDLEENEEEKSRMLDEVGKLLRKGENLFSDYRSGKPGQKTPGASEVLAQSCEKIWLAFYTVTEAAVGQKLETPSDVKKVHINTLGLPKKFFETANDLHQYFYQGLEANREKIEKKFKAVIEYIKTRMEDLKELKFRPESIDRYESFAKVESLLDKANKFFSDYESGEGYHKDDYKLKKATENVLTAFYAVTELSVQKKLKTLPALKAAHAEELNSSMKIYRAANNLRKYVYYSSEIERKKIEKNFATVSKYVENRIDSKRELELKEIIALS